MPKRIICATVICWLFLLCGQATAFDLTLLHVNDSHSYLDSTGGKLKLGGVSTYVDLGSWPRLVTAVNRVRSRNAHVALLHAGDAVQGGLYFVRYKGKPEMEFLDRLAFDAFVLGNHEFDKGPIALAAMLQNTAVPVLGGNIRVSCCPKLATRIKPYTILKYGSEHVGVIGLTTAETAIISSPGPAVRFLDETETARKYVRELEAQGVNKIILLTHVGIAEDKQLAATVPGVDVIIGGHSHTLLDDKQLANSLGLNPEGPYPVTVKGPDGNDVYIVQAWKWSRVLGQLDVTFDGRGIVTAVRGKPLILVGDRLRQKDEAGTKRVLAGAPLHRAEAEIKGSGVAEVVPADTAASDFLAPFTHGIQAMFSDVIGTVEEGLQHIRVPGVTASGVNLPTGSRIAPVVCESMLLKLASAGRSADIALLNAGAVRTGLPSGDLTIGEVYTLLPFRNSIHVLELTGAQFREALEYGVYKGDGAFPYVAGARYTADMNKPSGQRISGLLVRKNDGAWVPINTSRTYRVATNAYLAHGGDGYAILLQAQKDYETGFMDAQTFMDYVQKIKKLRPLKTSGITFIPAS